MRPSQLLAAVVALSSVSTAWPDVFDSTNAVGKIENMLYGRQDNSESAQPSTTESAEPSSTDDSKKTTDAPESTGDSSSSDKPTATQDGDSKTTDKASGSGKASKTSSKPTVTNFGNDVQAGGVQMVTPAAIAGMQFYKIGDWVTFAWNYTSLSVTPSAVDVMATCTANQATYTIAVNQSTEETGRVLWNTKNYLQDHPNAVPLLTETFTLQIYDAASSVSATPKPGYLAPYNQFTFGMYEPQSYTPWAEFKCANCNGSLSAFEKLTLKALFITSLTTIASLVYFAVSFGVW